MPLAVGAGDDFEPAEAADVEVEVLLDEGPEAGVGQAVHGDRVHCHHDQRECPASLCAETAAILFRPILMTLEQVKGCLLGQAVADALAAPFEGMPAEAIYYGFGMA